MFVLPRPVDRAIEGHLGGEATGSIPLAPPSVALTLMAALGSGVPSPVVSRHG